MSNATAYFKFPEYDACLSSAPKISHQLTYYLPQNNASSASAFRNEQLMLYPCTIPAPVVTTDVDDRMRQMSRIVKQGTEKLVPTKTNQAFKTPSKAKNVSSYIPHLDPCSLLQSSKEHKALKSNKWETATAPKLCQYKGVVDTHHQYSCHHHSRKTTAKKVSNGDRSSTYRLAVVNSSKCIHQRSDNTPFHQMTSNTTLNSRVKQCNKNFKYGEKKTNAPCYGVKEKQLKYRSKPVSTSESSRPVETTRILWPRCRSRSEKPGKFKASAKATQFSICKKIEQQETKPAFSFWCPSTWFRRKPASETLLERAAVQEPLYASRPKKKVRKKAVVGTIFAVQEANIHSAIYAAPHCCTSPLFTPSSQNRLKIAPTKLHLECYQMLGLEPAGADNDLDKQPFTPLMAADLQKSSQSTSAHTLETHPKIQQTPKNIDTSFHESIASDAEASACSWTSTTYEHPQTFDSVEPRFLEEKNGWIFVDLDIPELLRRKDHTLAPICDPLKPSSALLKNPLNDIYFANPLKETLTVSNFFEEPTPTQFPAPAPSKDILLLAPQSVALKTCARAFRPYKLTTSIPLAALLRKHLCAASEFYVLLFRFPRWFRFFLRWLHLLIARCILRLGFEIAQLYQRVTYCKCFALFLLLIFLCRNHFASWPSAKPFPRIIAPSNAASSHPLQPHSVSNGQRSNNPLVSLIRSSTLSCPFNCTTRCY